jgi:hypothetical protein
MRLATLLLATASLAYGYTVTNSGFVMLKNIDPIVLPGEFTSHLHTFFGSDAITVNTTTSKEVSSGCSTTENRNDKSSYCEATTEKYPKATKSFITGIPSLLHVKNGTFTPIVPFRFSAYYVSIENAEIPIPQNFKTVAGNSSAQSQLDIKAETGVQWFCEGDDGEAKDITAFPTSTCTTHLQTLLLFPDCVNSTTLESGYSGRSNIEIQTNRCPAGMQRIPQLRFSVRYDLRKIIPEGWSGAPPLTLSCGSSFCTHGDFINGWVEDAAENMLLANDKRKFAAVTGSLDDVAICPDSEVADADPENGTSDYLDSVALSNRKRSLRYGQRHTF